MINFDAGKLLIAAPFLKDPNFLRTVVLLCEHNEAGDFGLVLNRLFEQTLDELNTDFAGLVYKGPFVVRAIKQELGELLRRDGFSSLQKAVGVDWCKALC